jgi:hypothetical protein
MHVSMRTSQGQKWDGWKPVHFLLFAWVWRVTGHIFAAGVRTRAESIAGHDIANLELRFSGRLYRDPAPRLPGLVAYEAQNKTEPRDDYRLIARVFLTKQTAKSSGSAYCPQWRIKGGVHLVAEPGPCKCCLMETGDDCFNNGGIIDTITVAV